MRRMRRAHASPPCPRTGTRTGAIASASLPSHPPVRNTADGALRRRRRQLDAAWLGRIGRQDASDECDDLPCKVSRRHARTVDDPGCRPAEVGEVGLPQLPNPLLTVLDLCPHDVPVGVSLCRGRNPALVEEHGLLEGVPSNQTVPADDFHRKVYDLIVVLPRVSAQLRLRPI